MEFTNGLAILRRVSPPPSLERRLDASERLIVIETGSGRDVREIKHVDDSLPWDDEELTFAIVGRPTKDGSGMVGGCTDGWSVIDQNHRIVAHFTSLPRAEEAVSKARVEIRTEIEIEGLEEEAPVKPSRKPEPVVVSA